LLLSLLCSFLACSSRPSVRPVHGHADVMVHSKRRGGVVGRVIWLIERMVDTVDQ
jgi:hypothetical protein